MSNTIVPPRWASPQLPAYAFTEGDRVIEFAENFCRLQNTSYGGKAGDLIELRPWQKLTLQELFTCDGNGKRRYSTGLIGIPRKSGKSLLGSILALYALVTEENAFVISCASTSRQARLVFDEAKKMVQSSVELQEIISVHANHLENKATGGIYRAIAAEPNAAQGMNPTFVIFDEVHVQPNDDLWTAMTEALSARPNSMVVGITTAGHDQTSLCYRLYEYGKDVHLGTRQDPSYFFRWWEPKDSDCDYKDPAVWAECNPGFDDWQASGDFEASANRTPENQFRRYRLNQWTQTYSAWLKFGVFAALADSENGLEDGEAVTLGFDGSESNDTTALVACSIDRTYVQVLDVWEKDPNAADNRVSTAEVRDAIRAACKKYRVEEVVCDTHKFEESFETLKDEGLPMLNFPNTVPRLIKLTRIFEDLVYEGRLSHDGDERLTEHVNNCVLKTDRRTDTHYITKAYKGTDRKNDIAFAAVMAVNSAVFFKDNRRTPQFITDVGDDDYNDEDW